MFELSYTFKEFFSKVMKWMFSGLLITFVVSAISSLIINYASESICLLFMGIGLVASFVELFLVFQIRKSVMKLDYASARRHFISYSVASGLSLGIVCSLYSPFAVVLAFATTCAYFGLLYSITTVVKTDFSMVGSICVAALIPLIIASFFLIFTHSEALYWILTYAGMAIFTGLTLYDFKRIERAYEQSSEETADTMVLYLALELYLDFMNLFLYIIRLTNRRR